jgi:Ca2+/Na+ antiporter
MQSIVDLFLGRYRRIAEARARIGMIYAVAGLFVVFTLVALLVAGSVLLAEWVGAFAASLLVALFTCLIALVLLLVGVAQRNAARKREEEEAAAQRQALVLLAASLPVLKNRGLLITAVAVGLLVGLVTAPGKDEPEN